MGGMLKMKKRISCILLAICMITGLFAVGCGSDKADQSSKKSTKTIESVSTSDETTSETTEVSDTENNAATDTSENSNILVVYYSATGNTKAAAEKISAITDGTLFELQPAEAYTSDDLDYNDSESRVCKEHDNPDLQNIELTEVTPETFDSADFVILCYPIWWGEAAWPVNQFVKNNDFTGKTVIPVCTSASSGIGSSGEKLSELAGTGNWLDGKRFSSRVSEDEIQEWIDSLELK